MGNKPFLLFLSWGSPHEPYHTAPEKYKQMYSPEQIELRPNVPDELKTKAQNDIAGYYAHISALDDCMNELLVAIETQGIADNTIVVFTSDHGDMLYSHGMEKKQKPWDESLRIPFLLRYPGKLGKSKKIIDMPINTPDIMPTLLGLSGLEIPETVEGADYSKVITGEEKAKNDAVLIQCPVPFHQWNYQKGGREYRGVRTRQFTYVRDLNGPWLLYDNEKDPYQMNNLCNNPVYDNIQNDLENKLQRILSQREDQFLKGEKYMELWNYNWDNNDSIKKNQ
jgi:arylsulfatase A-like enzyme